AEQTESPAEARRRGGAKALVGRAIVRVVTAGTLTEEALLDARAANWLVAVAASGQGPEKRLGIAAAHLSTGRFEIAALPPLALDAELARLDAAEIVIPEDFDATPANAVPWPREHFDSLRGEERLKHLLGVATLDGFGAFTRPELAAAGAL